MMAALSWGALSGTFGSFLNRSMRSARAMSVKLGKFVLRLMWPNTSVSRGLAFCRHSVSLLSVALRAVLSCDSQNGHIDGSMKRFCDSFLMCSRSCSSALPGSVLVCSFVKMSSALWRRVPLMAAVLSSSGRLVFLVLGFLWHRARKGL